MHVEKWLKHADAMGMPLLEDLEIDSSLVKFYNQEFSNGEPVSVGLLTRAGLAHLVPRFVEDGDRKLPRSLRALKN